MTAARVIIWRHGRTEWNVNARFQGQADLPLDRVGYAQALRAAEVLAAYRPNALYSSDLSRSYQTAAVLAERTGLEIITDKRLREIHVGSWEGLLGEEIKAADPDLARRLWAGEEVRRSPTGESPGEVAERMAEALTEIVEAHNSRARNVHFVDQLIDGRLQFDYRMRPGVVQSTNALALMRNMGLDV